MRTLIIGAGGQLGTELAPALAQRLGPGQVLATDLKPPHMPEGIRTATLDVTDRPALERLIAQEEVGVIYHLAALLSATGEKDPRLAWRVNMDGLINVLEAALTANARVFWPSSIAAFGPHTPREATPQYTVMDPNTMYGTTKLAGELLCQYYHEKLGLDVRSLRYPGLISATTPPGGGTTDYAVHIFYEALQHGAYKCFLGPQTELPMMYMPDAVRATLALMDADAHQVRVRTSYNLAAMSFTPEALARELRRHMPQFRISYAPDFRQAIADSWPRSIDDSAARADWGWAHEFGLPELVEDMLAQLGPRIKPEAGAARA